MTYYTINEVAKMLKVDRHTVWRWIKDGKLESHKVGSTHRITQEQLDRFIKTK